MGIVVIWWLAVELVGLASLPLAVTVFARLPDRGWALAKPLGVLIFGWFVWFPLITIQALPYSAAWIVGTFVVYAAANVALLLRVPIVRERLLDLVSRARGYIVLTELFFAGAFAAFAWFRSFNPAVVDTEKFMDVAFISSLWRSPHLPAPDPWLSGYPINYYYFGHFLIATFAKVLGTQPGTAFNLGISLIFALTAVAVFGVALNLTAALRRKTTASLLRVAPFGLAAVFFVLIAGNLRGAQVWWQNALAATKYALALHGNPWAWWTNRTLWLGFDWWSPSRAIPNTITEFPSFSFALSDLHAHVLALPFAALAVALALNLLLARGEGLRLFEQGRLGWLVLAVTAVCLGGMYAINGWDLPTYLGLALLALIVQQWLAHGRRWSSTFVLNTLAVGSLLGALCLLAYLPFYRGFISPSQGIGGVDPTDRSLIGDEVVIFGLPVFILGSLLVIWLTRWVGEAFASWYTGASPIYSETPRSEWTWLERNARPVGSAAFLWVLAIFVLFTLKSQGNMGWTLFWCVALVLGSAAFILRTLVARRAADSDSPIAEDADDSRRAEIWMLCLFGTAAALVAGCELLFVRDIFNSRMNTVFKLYYQAWLLLGIAASPALAWLIGAARRTVAASLAPSTPHADVALTTAPLAQPASSLAFAGTGSSKASSSLAMSLLDRTAASASRRRGGSTNGNDALGAGSTRWGVRATRLLPVALRGLRPAGILLWSAVLVALVLAAMIYPVLAASARTNNFTQQPGLTGTLDGTAYMADDSTSVPVDCVNEVGEGSNRGDNYAIAWLNTHVSGSPVILEAPGCEWSHYSRISSFTGLPTLLGWPGGHEGEWRINWPLLQTTDVFGQRTNAINTIYTSTDEQTVLSLLRQYAVKYVYVGVAERNLYATADLDRFSAYLKTVYKYDGVTIYAVS